MRSSGASAAPRSRPSRSACARGRPRSAQPAAPAAPAPPQAGWRALHARERPAELPGGPTSAIADRACTGRMLSQVQPRGRGPSGQTAAACRWSAEARKAQAGAAPRTPRAISGRACATWPGVATTSWPACSSASRCAAGVSAASALTRRSAPQRAATASASSRTCPPQLRVSQGSHSLYGAPVRQGKRADRRVTCPGRETPNDSLPGHVKRQSA